MTADLFGTPEPVREEPRVFTVSELTRSVRSVLEDHIGVVWVEGEISNYRKQASGHQYFTLKDAQSQISCVWFARQGFRLKQLPLSDGMQVQVRGSMTVYEARGQYQLNVQFAQAGGAGLLQAKFEALKRKLEAEGLFDPARKRPLPRFPVSIGIVTSPTGAALRDMLNILARRAPWARVVIGPARVQGDGAAAEIAAAVEAFNRFESVGLKPVDVIVVARGGGSVEDLWAFNEEIVARAIAASVIPVVSAVGHEIDFSIADFAADLRAPTPSAAAELIVPDTQTLLRRVAQLSAQAFRIASGMVGRERARLDFLARSALFREPRARLAESAQRADSAAEALRRALRNKLDLARRRLAAGFAALRHHRPDQLLAMRRHLFEAVRLRLAERTQHALLQRRASFERAAQVFRLLAPDATLARGYSITLKPGGAVVRSANELRAGESITTRFRDGAVQSRVEDPTPPP
jgi:exodeoxyribonuclease VII large subunit